MCYYFNLFFSPVNKVTAKRVIKCPLVIIKIDLIKLILSDIPHYSNKTFSAHVTYLKRRMIRVSEIIHPVLDLDAS